MKAALQQLLDRSLPLPGVAACCALLPDRSCVSRCYNDWFQTGQGEQALSRLAAAADGLLDHGIRPLQVNWVFEHIRIHLAVRRDAACLALFVEIRPGVDNGKLAGLLEEFAALPAG